MMSIGRLDSLYPNLAESFRRAPPFKRRHAVRIACEESIASAGISEPEVTVALGLLRVDEYGYAALRASLEALVARLDDEYLRLQAEEASDSTRILRVFSTARAVSALAFALSDNPSELQEAIYEAIVAMDAPHQLVELVENALL